MLSNLLLVYYNMGDLFKVRVIKTRNEDFWYGRHIGEIFTVKWSDEDLDDVVIMDNDYPNEGVMVNMASIERDDIEILPIMTPYKRISKHII